MYICMLNPIILGLLDPHHQSPTLLPIHSLAREGEPPPIPPAAVVGAEQALATRHGEQKPRKRWECNPHNYGQYIHF